MKTQADFEYDYIERMAMMTIDSNQSEPMAHVEATYQVRQDMVVHGIDFGTANLKVMGIRGMYASA